VRRLARHRVGDNGAEVTALGHEAMWSSQFISVV
jgi:hypothetical protein